MNDSSFGGCVAWLSSFLFILMLGTAFIVDLNSQESTVSQATDTPTCQAILSIASPQGISDPSEAFAFGVRIAYQGNPLDNVWVSIDSTYTRNSLVINGSGFYDNVGADSGISIEQDDRIDFYYEGFVKPTETVILVSDTERVTCTVTTSFD